MKSLLIARWWVNGALFLLMIIGMAACGQVYEAPKKTEPKPLVQRNLDEFRFAGREAARQFVNLPEHAANPAARRPTRHSSPGG